MTVSVKISLLEIYCCNCGKKSVVENSVLPEGWSASLHRFFDHAGAAFACSPECMALITPERLCQVTEVKYANAK